MLCKFVTWDEVMEQEIEALRIKLNRLVERGDCLHSKEVIKLSKELDNLIYMYYKSFTVTSD